MARTFTRIHSERPKATKADECVPGWHRRARLEQDEPLAALFGPDRTVLFVADDASRSKFVINVGTGGVYVILPSQLDDLFVPLDFTFTLTVAP